MNLNNPVRAQIQRTVCRLVRLTALMLALGWAILTLVAFVLTLSRQTIWYIFCVAIVALLLYSLLSKRAIMGGIIRIAILCLIAFLGYKYAIADPPGYCKAQNRYISDMEFANTVIVLVQADIKGRKPKKGDSSFYENWDGYVPAIGDSSDIEVRRKATYLAFNRMFGWQEVEVWITPPKKKGAFYNVVTFYFDVCGRLLDSDIGMPYSSTPVTTTSIGKQHGF